MGSMAAFDQAGASIAPFVVLLVSITSICPALDGKQRLLYSRLLTCVFLRTISFALIGFCDFLILILLTQSNESARVLF